MYEIAGIELMRQRAEQVERAAERARLVREARRAPRHSSQPRR
jgi:hypothetical protein